jgi:hypothetical protein
LLGVTEPADLVRGLYARDPARDERHHHVPMQLFEMRDVSAVFGQLGVMKPDHPGVATPPKHKAT